MTHTATCRQGDDAAYDRMTRFATVATCSLNQFAMDFDGNLERIKESIRQAKAKGARLRVGPELEITGYSCEDHFYESDTLVHSWESLADILRTDLTDDILCDFGMPVMHQSVRYNCRVICLDRKVLLIRPKMNLADAGNYREARWFTEWSRGLSVEEFLLPRMISNITGQVKVPIGCAMVVLADTMYAVESCEELFCVNNVGSRLSLAGAEIFGNGSGSHHSLRKRLRRFELIGEFTRKAGGVYLYANQQGMDGNRLYFDGSASITMNGKQLRLGKQFDISDVEVVTATISLLDVWNYRASIASRAVQSATCEPVPRVDALHFRITCPRHMLVTPLTLPLPSSAVCLHSEEEEVAFGPACWLWDYLRRSGMPGYFLPLSGGVDSASTATLVAIMCQLVVEKVKQNDPITIADVKRITRDPDFVPQDAKELCGRIFFCVYMGTKNSSEETLTRARDLANDIGCSFNSVVIDPIVSAFENAFETMTGHKPDITNFNSQENIACQNIQARSRMVLAYECAQLMLCTLPQNKGKKWPGNLCVLGSANLSEALTGFYTKFDCSSADINPIGGISKPLLVKFLRWACHERGFFSLTPIVEAKPTPELQPTVDGKQAQVSEEDIGLSFDTIAVFGKLRIEERAGPLLAYHKLRDLWPDKAPDEIAEKVKFFFSKYAKNRHKVTILPMAYHLEDDGCDDNRYDLRQILYNVNWPRQFAELDQAVKVDMDVAKQPPMSLEEKAPAAVSHMVRQMSQPPDSMMNAAGVTTPTLSSGGAAAEDEEAHKIQHAIALLKSAGYSVHTSHTSF